MLGSKTSIEAIALRSAVGPVGPPQLLHLKICVRGGCGKKKHFKILVVGHSSSPPHPFSDPNPYTAIVFTIIGGGSSRRET